MNIDEQIKKIQNEDINRIDSKDFIKNLHHQRMQNDVRTSRFISGVASFCILAIFSAITVNQLADDSTFYVATDLKPYEQMDAETESYVIELADYLIISSEDIWETLHFFDEINFNNLIASNYGDINE
jgi:hypothetical protein|tara:strand:- start:67 stop:450 length:384 start_codon:yes stop_codon:yes gene_type:complete